MPTRSEPLRIIRRSAGERGDDMSDAIITALITGGVTLVGVLVSNRAAQAVTETKLEELTREVREHNNFAKRVPLLEKDVEYIKDRLEDLETDK